MKFVGTTYLIQKFGSSFIDDPKNDNPNFEVRNIQNLKKKITPGSNIQIFKISKFMTLLHNHIGLLNLKKAKGHQQ